MTDMDPTHRYEYIVSWSHTWGQWTVLMTRAEYEGEMVDTVMAATAQEALAKALESARTHEGAKDA